MREGSRFSAVSKVYTVLVGSREAIVVKALLS